MLGCIGGMFRTTSCPFYRRDTIDWWWRACRFRSPCSGPLKTCFSWRCWCILIVGKSWCCLVDTWFLKCAATKTGLETAWFLSLTLLFSLFSVSLVRETFLIPALGFLMEHATIWSDWEQHLTSLGNVVRLCFCFYCSSVHYNYMILISFQ